MLFSAVVLGAPDIVVQDRIALRGFGHVHLVEPHFQDRFDEGIIARLDFQRAHRSSLEPIGTEALGKAELAGSSDSRAASTQPALPPPAIT